MTALSPSRITLTNTINFNIFGQNCISYNFPKKIKFTGDLCYSSPSVMVKLCWRDKNNYPMSIGANRCMIVDSEIVIGDTKGCTECASPEGKEVFLCVYARTGELIHSQPYNKRVKVVDKGIC